MNPLLLEAITKNDTNKFQQLLKESDEEGIGKDTLLNQTTKVSLDTTLHLACRFGHVNLVADIAGLQPDLVAATNASQETPVHEACRGGYLEMLELLLTANPWVSHWSNVENQSALFLACENGHHKLARSLLKHHPRTTLHLFDKSGADLPCLHVAVSRGHAAVVHELIQAWPTLAEKVDEKGCNSLHHACRSGNAEITRMLLTLYPKLAVCYDNGGFTPLHIAAIFGKAAVFKEFEELIPSAFQFMTKDQETVLHLMIRHNRIAAFFISMQFFGNCNALFNTRDTSGNSPLHLALTTKCLEVAEYLINKATSEELETRNYAGFTPEDILEMSNQDDLVTQHLKDCLLNRLTNIEFAQLQQQHHQDQVIGSGVQVTEGNTSLPVPQSNIVAAPSPQIESIPQHQEKTGFDHVGNESNGRENDFISDVASPPTDTTSKNNREVVSVPTIQVNQEQQRRTETHLNESLEALLKLQKMMKEGKEDYEKRRQKKMQAMHMEALQNARNTIIIIAVLITTVTFTASLSPPGGFFQGGPQIGKPVLGKLTAFKVFEISNDIALFLSLCIVIVLVSIVPFRKRPLRKLLGLAHKALWLAVSFLATAYVAARWATLMHVRQEERLFGVVLSICGGFLGVVFLWSGVMLVNKKLKKSEWRRKRSRQPKCKSVSTDSDMESHVGDGFHWY